MEFVNERHEVYSISNKAHETISRIAKLIDFNLMKKAVKFYVSKITRFHLSPSLLSI